MRTTVRRSILQWRTEGGVARPHLAAHPITVAARLSAILALTLVVPVVGATHTALATGARSPRSLTLADFADQQGAQDVSDTADGTVSGVRYAHATLLGIHAASIALFTHAYAGYTRLAFDVGVSDTSIPGRTSTLDMSADGHPANARVGRRWVDTVVQRYGQTVTHVVIFFGHAGLITLAADPNELQGIEDLVIANPTLLR